MSDGHALSRLVDRLLEGRVVLFLGAGVSNGARIPGDSEFQPTLKWMKNQLRARAEELENCGRIDPLELPRFHGHLMI